MAGAARAAERRRHADLSLAWHSAAFGGAVQVGKLKKLSHYLGAGDVQQQSPDQMLTTLRALQDMGAPMDIKQVN